MAGSSVDTIFENLGKMSVLELVEFGSAGEDRWKVRLVVPVGDK